MQVRTPAVAGMFYPSEKNKLTKLIEDCFLHQFGPGKKPPKKLENKIFGVICPHAGFVYSGPIACNSLYSISSESPELFIIIGPNHWGIGRSVATMKDCEWQTPLGNVQVDSESAEEISKLSKTIEPEVFGNIVFSASIAICRISSLDFSVKTPEIAAAPATQHAEDDPSPTPTGISESMVISIPDFSSYF